MNTNKLLRNIRAGRSPFVVIAITTLAAIAIGIYCLSHGWVIIFQNLFYFPIVIACAYYTKRGFVFSVALSFVYFFLIASFTRNSTVATEALIRVAVFVGVAGVTTFLSVMRERAKERLNAMTLDLKRKTELLELSNKELEAFSYSVSHDLRAPLRSIDGFSKAILEDYSDKLDERGKNCLGRVCAASQQMAQLIEDMLMLSRINRSEMRRKKVDLSALAKSIADELMRNGPQRKAEFVIAPSVTANGDKQLLGILLHNLLENAWKFTGKHPSARIELGVTKNEETAYFVSDDGAGFNMKYADRLFGAFQRLHTSEEFEGTGIGLAIVQRIVSRHGGKVWAQGEVEKGATFYFTLG